MQAGDVKLGKVFANDHQSVIPLFQRPYVWDEEKNWKPLWQDIRKATEELELEQAPDGFDQLPRTYFLGAVVIQQRRRPPKRLASSNIIDGQQRMTTLQVLIAAARAVAHEHGAESVAGRLASLVENRPETVHDEYPSDRYKVWPLPQDRDAFLWAVRRPEDNLPAPDSDHRLVRARGWFEKEIAEWAAVASDPAERLEALHFVLQDRMQLVEITLDLSDDPQVIFEALNYRGVPLAAVDLVKNLLFQALDAQGEGKQAEELLTNHWLELDGKYWRGEVTTGRIRRVLVDLLLAYWLTIRTKQEVLVDHLFVDFKRWMEKDTVAASTVIRELHHNADTYRSLERLPAADPTAQLLDSMQATGTTTPWPVILYLHANSEIPAEQRCVASPAIDSYLMRRGICDWTAKDYNRLFLQVLSVAQEADPSNAGHAVARCLAGQTSESRAWPTDTEFHDGLLSAHLFLNVNRTRLKSLLVGLENHLRTEKTETRPQLSCRDTKLNIEHVMPRKWATNWTLPTDATEEATLRREDHVHRLGNLTLTTVKLNSAMSNNAWMQKRLDLRTYSLLLLTTTTILAKPRGQAGWDDESWTSEWEENRIDIRGNWLATHAIEAWPLPVEFVDATDPTHQPPYDDQGPA